jgi:hypothetical protein
MSFEEKEEDEIIDWEWIQKQPLWYRNKVSKGKTRPMLKKQIRKEKRDAEKKYRD